MTAQTVTLPSGVFPVAISNGAKSDVIACDGTTNNQLFANTDRNKRVLLIISILLLQSFLFLLTRGRKFSKISIFDSAPSSVDVRNIASP